MADESTQSSPILNPLVPTTPASPPVETNENTPRLTTQRREQQRRKEEAEKVMVNNGGGGSWGWGSVWSAVSGLGT